MTCPNCAELARKLQEAQAACAVYVDALKSVHELPIETDANGHAFKRVRCRSVFDLGANLAALLEHPSPGEVVAAILARLDDDELADVVAKKYGGERHCLSIHGCWGEAIDAYRTAVRGEQERTS